MPRENRVKEELKKFVISLKETILNKDSFMQSDSIECKKSSHTLINHLLYRVENASDHVFVDEPISPLTDESSDQYYMY